MYPDDFPKVRYYKEETRCSHCGRHIKNVVEIDGARYGTGCCEAFLPRFVTVSKATHEVFVDVRGMYGEAEKVLGSELFRRYCTWGTDNLQQYYEKAVARSHPNAAGVKWILAARQAGDAKR